METSEREEAGGARGRTRGGEVSSLVLVAEDNEVNRNLISRQLARLGYRCELAGSGYEALRRWLAGGIDLVLTDLRMPDMSGFELCDAIRAHEAIAGGRVPIVAVSANAYDDQARECLARGMDDYLPKPVVMERLREVLECWGRAVVKAPVMEPDATGASEGGETALAVLDRAVLIGLVGDDEAAVRDILSDFLPHALAICEGMQAAWARESLSDVCNLSHKLKSSARSVGALRLGDLCHRLEQAAGGSRAEEVARLMPAIAPLVREVEAGIRSL